VAVWATPYRLALRYHRGSLRGYISFSAPLAIAGLVGIVMFQIIYIVGGVAIGLAGLGAFTLVGNFAQFTNQADAIVTNTLYPAICAVRDRAELLAEIFVKSNRLSLMWAVPFGVGLTLFCTDLFRFVIGHRWLPAVGLMEIMGLVTAIHHVGYNWTAFFRACGRTWPIAAVAVASVVVMVAVAVPLMFSIGLIGIGYAFAASEVVSLVMRAVLLARFFEGFRLQRHLIRAFQPTLVAAGPVLLWRALAGPEHSLLAAAAMFALYAILTVGATLALERPLIREARSYAWTPRSALSTSS
jgi:O-antigen/teichoic acid export membrane protein